MKSRHLLFSLAFFAPLAIAAEAPFCVVGSGPAGCFYWDVQSCQSAARSLGGMCAPNPEAMSRARPAPYEPYRSTSRPIDVMMGDMQRSLNEGQRMRAEQEESRARIGLLRAQTEAAGRVPVNVSGPHVTYQCPDGKGSTYQTVDVPIVSCIVTSVTY